MNILIDLSILRHPYCGLGQIALNYGRWYARHAQGLEPGTVVTLLVPRSHIGAFGEDVLDEEGNVDRRVLARKAFKTPADTRKLNRITLPRIEDAFTTKLAELEAAGCEAVVVEHTVFKNRAMSMADMADVIIAVLAPLDVRIQRAVASGFDEKDVRRRIAQQITDAERIEKADVVFNNDGTQEELYNKVVNWWNDYTSSV